MQGTLTICIPSFNRFKALDRLLESLLKETQDIEQIDQILFVDDGYENDSVRLIKEKYKKFSKFRYHKNKNTGSFGSVYAECLTEANSDFILITNDDDFLYLKEITACLNHFFTLTQTGLVSPIWLSNANRIIRGNQSNRIIKANEILKYTAHAPGLIFSKIAISEHLKALKERLEKKCLFCMTYPQVFLSALLIDNSYKIYSLNYTVGRDDLSLPTEIKSPNGDEYFSLKSRLLQYLSLLVIKDDKILSNDVLDPLCSNFVGRILLHHNNNFLYSTMSFVINRRFVEFYRNTKFKLNQIIKLEKK